MKLPHHSHRLMLIHTLRASRQKSLRWWAAGALTCLACSSSDGTPSGAAGRGAGEGVGGQLVGRDGGDGTESGTGQSGASGSSGLGGLSGDSSVLGQGGGPGAGGRGAGTGGSAGSMGVGGSIGTGGSGGGAGSRQDAAAGGGSPSADASAPVPSTCPAVTDFAAPGPFTTTEEPGGSTCTIFRPNPLGAQGCKHPIIVWGNGTTATPAVYRQVLTHWASHGFVVAAANTTNAGTGAEMIACLEFVLQQSSTAGSAFFGKVDTSHVGASGHSQGGGGTLMAGRDARITATAPLEPFTAQGFGGFDTASIRAQKGPMFLMSGSADNIATPKPNQQIVFDGATVPVFWGTLAGADHVNSGTGNISGFRGPATAWLRLNLMGDESARRLFYGTTCTLCSDPSWSVQRKNIQ